MIDKDLIILCLVVMLAVSSLVLLFWAAKASRYKRILDDAERAIDVLHEEAEIFVKTDKEQRDIIDTLKRKAFLELAIEDDKTWSSEHPTEEGVYLALSEESRVAKGIGPLETTYLVHVVFLWGKAPCLTAEVNQMVYNGFAGLGRGADTEDLTWWRPLMHEVRDPKHGDLMGNKVRET